MSDDTTKIHREWIEQYGFCNLRKRKIGVEAFYTGITIRQGTATQVGRVAVIIRINGRIVMSNESTHAMPAVGQDGILTQVAIMAAERNSEFAKWQSILEEFGRRCQNIKTGVQTMRWVPQEF